MNTKKLRALLLFVVFFVPLFSQGKTNKEGVELEVLETVNVKPGEGCLQVFKRTKHPLSLRGCGVFFERIKRTSWIDERVPMMRVVMDPVLYPGETFAYVRRHGWVPVDKN